MRLSHPFGGVMCWLNILSTEPKNDQPPKAAGRPPPTHDGYLSWRGLGKNTPPLRLYKVAQDGQNVNREEKCDHRRRHVS